MASQCFSTDFKLIWNVGIQRTQYFFSANETLSATNDNKKTCGSGIYKDKVLMITYERFTSDVIVNQPTKDGKQMELTVVILQIHKLSY